MKTQSIQIGSINSKYIKENNQNFKGSFLDAATKGLQMCDKYPMIGVALTDSVATDVPRTIFDLVKTGVPAAMETARREFSGLFVNCLMPSFIVLGAAKFLNKGTMGKEVSDINLSNSWANGESINKFVETFKNSMDVTSKTTTQSEIKTFFNNIFTGLNGRDGDKWVEFSSALGKDKLEEVSELLTKAVFDNSGDKKALKEKNHDTNRDNKTIKKSREIILLQNYRWVLLRNRDEIHYSYNRYYHKLLGMNVDTYTIEKLFLQLDSNFEGLRELKEDYIQFNQTEYDNEFDILLDLKDLIDKYDRSEQSVFRDFAGFLRKNLTPIVNSFTRIKVYRKSARLEKEYYARLSNGPMESFNRKPKDLKRITRGVSDFNYTRNRILWATRKNPTIKGVPKSMDQILSKKGKKRGSYKKKKNK